MVRGGVSLSGSGVALVQSVLLAPLIHGSPVACQKVLASITGSNVSGRLFSAGDQMDSDRQIRLCETSMSEYVVTLVEWDNARVNRADQIMLV